MLNWLRPCALALLLAPAVVIGQSRVDEPTFRSGVQSIEVDVLVTDKSGKVVRGLTKEDFTLIEDDAPQQISTFTFVDLPIIPANKVFTLDFTPESQRAARRDGIRVVVRIERPRGRHQVRFAVHQPNGKTGSVVADVQIPDYAAPLSMSGVLLASQQAAAHHTLSTDPQWTSVLGSAPTSVRRFGRGDVVSAYAEIYTGSAQSGSARMSATVVSNTGKKVATVDASVVPGDEPGRTGYVARIPLADLHAGEFVLDFEARAGRAKATRQVPFTVLSD